MNSQKSVIGFHFMHFAGEFPWIDNNTKQNVYTIAAVYIFVVVVVSSVCFTNAINFARFSKLELINVKLWSKITRLPKMAGG